MRKPIIIFMLAAMPAVVLAQATETVQRSSSPRGVQVQGEMSINAVGQGVNSVAVGQGNTAKNAMGSVGGNVKIQGNTRINAVGVNSNAVSVGKGNKASNTIGSIGAD